VRDLSWLANYTHWLGPPRDVFHQPGCRRFIVGPDGPCLYSLLDELGGPCAGTVAVFQPESLAQGAVGQILPLHVTQAGMQVAGANPINRTHFGQWARGEEGGAR